MTCAPHDLACRLDRIATALQAGPDGWTIAAVVIAGVGVFASTAVALIAYLSSRRAVKIAGGADTREVKRDEERARERVDQWLAEFLVAAADYRTQLEAWAPYANRPWRIDEPPPVPKLNPARMLSALEAARLVARDRDQEILGTVADYARTAAGLAVDNAIKGTTGLAERVRDWRNDTLDWGELIAWIRGKPFVRG